MSIDWVFQYTDYGPKTHILSLHGLLNHMSFVCLHITTLSIPEPSNVPGKNKQLRFVPFLAVVGKTFVFFWNARILGFHWFQGISINPSPILIAILAALGDWKLRRLQFKAHWRAHVYACVCVWVHAVLFHPKPRKVAWLGIGVFDITQAWQGGRGWGLRMPPISPNGWFTVPAWGFRDFKPVKINLPCSANLLATGILLAYLVGEFKEDLGGGPCFFFFGPWIFPLWMCHESMVS